MQGHHVSLAQQLLEAVLGFVVVGVVRDDPQTQPGQPPPQRTADGTQAHQPGGESSDLAAAEPLIWDAAVAKDVAAADIRVCGQQVTGGGQEQGHRHLGDRVSVAARGVQHRDAGRGGSWDVDVVGVPAGGRDRAQAQLEHRSAHRVAFHHNNIGGFGSDPVGQLLGAVDPQRGLNDPRVVHHVGQLPELGEPRSTQRGCHQGAWSRRHECQCWRTVTPVSREDVTIGIDVGSTAVKAVAADADGHVTARVRIPHQLRVPAPDRLEHDADEAWRRGPLAALDQLGSVPTPGGGRFGDGAVVDRRRLRGQAHHAGIAVRRRRGRVRAPTTSRFRRWARPPSFCAGPPPKRPTRPDTGRHRRWPTTRWRARRLIDFATAATAFPLFDGTGWNPTACADRGARVEQMPRVETIGAAAGQVHGTKAVLAIGAIDALCEQIVAGADHDGDVLVLCGTTLIVWTTIPEARQVPGLWTIPHTAAGKSQIGGASNAGGLFLGWVDRVVGPGDPMAVDPRRVPVWSPYIRGERTPFHDPDRRAVLDALDLTHDAASLRRAAYEASGFVVRQLIELSGAAVARIVVAGGGTRVRPWMQAIADATGRPVEVSGVAEGAALGAAFLGRMAVGLETTITDAARWASTERIVEPDPGWAAAIEDRYQRFLELGNRRCSAIPPAAF